MPRFLSKVIGYQILKNTAFIPFMLNILRLILKITKYLSSHIIEVQNKLTERGK